jgi:Protein of unknown function (DUF3800)
MILPATLELTNYLDDSGSHDESPIVAIGGPVMSKMEFVSFDTRLTKILKQYRIPPPFHMTDFVRPNGQHVGIGKEMKLALFSDVAKAINESKVFSFAIIIPQVEFKTLLSPEVCRTVMGPYAAAFFVSVLFNQGIVSHSPILSLHLERIAYLVDHGSAFPEQLIKAHAAILEWERTTKGTSYVGTLAFDTDDRVSPLQAADAIAWSARRQQLGTLVEEFEPLAGMVLKNQGENFGKLGL